MSETEIAEAEIVQEGGQVLVPRESSLPSGPVDPDSMIQVALSHGADLDQIEKLIALKERCDANDAKKAYVKAMAKFRKNCPVIKKTKMGQSSKYAGLAETIEQIKTEMSKAGLSHSWETVQDGNLITVTCLVTHIDGHTARTTLSGEPDVGGNKNKIQAVGSTVAYLERYTLYAALGLASSDMDNDGGDGAPAPGQETITEDQLGDLRALIDEVKADEAQFLKFCKVEKLEDIKQRNLKRAINALEAKR